MKNNDAINQPDIVKNQYQSSSNLNTRISIHDKYSTNKMGFSNWIFSNYEIPEGSRILELGCGTGSMWVGKDEEVRKCGKIILSDFSEGMIDTARATLSSYDKIEYQVIDIQNIPFEDDSFDIVIANMMLYHVPDLNKGLSEVRRVLKDGGAFYCATFGEHGIMEYLAGLLRECGVEDNTNKSFTLQNGSQYLKSAFEKVERQDYKDSLAVTNADDLIDYIYSLTSMTTLSSRNRDEIREALTKEMTDGVLNVPKDYGMFICG